MSKFSHEKWHFHFTLIIPFSFRPWNLLPFLILHHFYRNNTFLTSTWTEIFAIKVSLRFPTKMSAVASADHQSSCSQPNRIPHEILHRKHVLYWFQLNTTTKLFNKNQMSTKSFSRPAFCFSHLTPIWHLSWKWPKQNRFQHPTHPFHFKFGQESDSDVKSNVGSHPTKIHLFDLFITQMTSSIV